MQKIKHLNQNGFMLIETLLVSLTIATILIYMYVQFSGINDSYRRVKTYNTIESQYRAEVIKHWLMLNTSANIPFTSNSDPTYNNLPKYLISDMGNCKSNAGATMPVNSTQRNDARIDYFCDLAKKLGVEYVILAAGDSDLQNWSSARAGLAAFMRQQDTYSPDDSEYRLIVRFTDSTFASAVFSPYEW